MPNSPTKKKELEEALRERKKGMDATYDAYEAGIHIAKGRQKELERQNRRKTRLMYVMYLTRRFEPYVRL